MIGERLSEQRKFKGITQEQLGKTISTTKYSISSYECERTEPNDALKVEIAKTLDISLDYLLGLVDEPVSYIKGKNTIILPSELSQTVINEIKEFIDYQLSKDKNKKS